MRRTEHIAAFHGFIQFVNQMFNGRTPAGFSGYGAESGVGR
jgi:hypothetical protein